MSSSNRRQRVEVSIDEEQGVFMISVAAELADMHPQTLRIYESRGLIEPKRSPKNTRLYSQRDVELLRRIQRMTGEEGLNLAGVEAVLGLERQLESLKSELRRTRARAREMERRLVTALARAEARSNTEIIPYGAYESAIPRSRRTVRIPVERRRDERRKESS
jgi:MerR family transcriptional regulator/heat shock protein HspR